MTNKERIDIMPAIEPYVTTKGNVVIGRFSIDQARSVATLCKAAPDLLNALIDLVEQIESVWNPHGAEGLGLSRAKAAIAKAKP